MRIVGMIVLNASVALLVLCLVWSLLEDRDA